MKIRGFASFQAGKGWADYSVAGLNISTWSFFDSERVTTIAGPRHTFSWFRVGARSYLVPQSASYSLSCTWRRSDLDFSPRHTSCDSTWVLASLPRYQLVIMKPPQSHCGCGNPSPRRGVCRSYLRGTNSAAGGFTPPPSSERPNWAVSHRTRVADLQCALDIFRCSLGTVCPEVINVSC